MWQPSCKHAYAGVQRHLSHDSVQRLWLQTNLLLRPRYSTPTHTQKGLRLRPVKSSRCLGAQRQLTLAQLRLLCCAIFDEQHTGQLGQLIPCGSIGSQESRSHRSAQNKSSYSKMATCPSLSEAATVFGSTRSCMLSATGTLRLVRRTI